MSDFSKIVVAIDGHSSSGKSTLAKDLALKLGYVYVDSGAMYRAVARYLIDHHIDVLDTQKVIDSLNEIEIRIENNGKGNEVFLNGENVNQSIRHPEITDIVSEVAVIPQVRAKLVELQRSFSKTKGIVMDGRDIGTVVFPDAELKLFVTAKDSIRAERRLLELRAKSIDINFEEVLANLKHRDHIDSTRKDSPLKKADDAHLIDTSQLDQESQLKRVIELYKAISEDY